MIFLTRCTNYGTPPTDTFMHVSNQPGSYTHGVPPPHLSWMIWMHSAVQFISSPIVVSSPIRCCMQDQGNKCTITLNHTPHAQDQSQARPRLLKLPGNLFNQRLVFNTHTRTPLIQLVHQPIDIKKKATTPPRPHTAAAPNLYFLLELVSAALQPLNRLLLCARQREIHERVRTRGTIRRRHHHRRVGVLPGQLFRALTLAEGHICKGLSRV